MSSRLIPPPQRIAVALILLACIPASIPAAAAPAFTFNKLNDAEGWTAANAMSEPTVRNGLLRTTITETDPQLVSAEGLGLDAAASPWLLLRAECSIPGIGRLFWRGVGESFAEGRIIGGFAGEPGAGGPADAPAGYLSPLRKATLGKDTVFEYEYDLIVGTLDEIRAWVYAKQGSGASN